jgi:hypothetical protein
MNRDHEPLCTVCGTDSPLSNTSAFGWICDDCLIEEERLETLDFEEHDRRKYERLAENQEY